MKVIYKMIAEHLPNVTERECEYILKGTDYPLCSLERLEHQVRRECLDYRRRKVLG